MAIWPVATILEALDVYVIIFPKQAAILTSFPQGSTSGLPAVTKRHCTVSPWPPTESKSAVLFRGKHCVNGYGMDREDLSGRECI